MSNSPLQDLRYRISEPYLRGRGIELGAGTSPQRVPDAVTVEQFDKRTVAELAAYFQARPNRFEPTRSLEELPQRFPEGADFLIAHHVLEHCSNPIGALAQWHTYVRNAGTVVVSLPHVDHCPDKGRHVPSLDHLLMDHLLDRGDDTFESREHIYSFVMGWRDDGFAKGIDKWAMAKQAHLCASSPGNDLHWHAYRPELVLSLIEAAAMFSGCRATIRASGHPDATGDQLRTESEIIFVYTLERMPAHLRAPAPATTAAVVKSVEQKLERALRLVQRATTRGESIGS